MQITGITSASRSQLLIHSVKIELRLCLEQANAPKKLLIQYRRESIKNKIKDGIFQVLWSGFLGWGKAGIVRQRGSNQKKIQKY